MKSITKSFGSTSKKDQINSQLRDFVVARYQSYINAELDPDKVARERGRKNWNDVTARVQMAALDLRKIKESIEKATRERAEAIEKTNAIRKQKVDSSLKISEMGKELEIQFVGFATKNKEVKAAREAVYQVRFANEELGDALKTDEVPKAKAAANKIEGNVYTIRSLGGQPVDVLEVVELNTELQRSVENYAKLAKKFKEYQSTVAGVEEKFAATLDDAVDSLKNTGTRLTSVE